MLVSRQIIRRRRFADRARAADRQGCRRGGNHARQVHRAARTTPPHRRVVFLVAPESPVGFLADPHLASLEAEFLRQTHRLAAAVHEQLLRLQSWVFSVWIDTIGIYHRSGGSVSPTP